MCVCYVANISCGIVRFGQNVFLYSFWAENARAENFNGVELLITAVDSF